MQELIQALIRKPTPIEAGNRAEKDQGVESAVSGLFPAAAAAYQIVKEHGAEERAPPPAEQPGQDQQQKGPEEQLTTDRHGLRSW